MKNGPIAGSGLTGSFVLLVVVAGCGTGGGDVPVTDIPDAGDLLEDVHDDDGSTNDPGSDIGTLDPAPPPDIEDTREDAFQGMDEAVEDTGPEPELPPECFTDYHCNDQDACTEDRCGEDRQCTNKPVDCSDGNPCTDDGCDSESGCFHDVVPNCLPSECGTDEDCKDDNPCTTDEVCDEGGCDFVLKGCEDGKPCTLDYCNPDTGDCVHQGNCEDGDLCTYDFCDPQSNYTCKHMKMNCNDDDECIEDTCDPVIGCVYWLVEGCVPACSSGSECDDQDECTDDTCLHDVCNHAWAESCCKVNPDCDDDDPCTFDWCDPPKHGQCRHENYPGCT